jgi:hypothetical protein
MAKQIIELLPDGGARVSLTCDRCRQQVRWTEVRKDVAGEELLVGACGCARQAHGYVLTVNEKSRSTS